MHKPSVIVGYGELVFDHVFVEEGSGSFYKGCRGGGSVWNTLVNLSAEGFATSAVGCGGDDLYGRMAKSELAQFGAKVSDVDLLPSKSTRIIFQLTKAPRGIELLPVHTFSAKCLVCGKSFPDKRLARASQSQDLDRHPLDSRTILCLDRLTRDRANLVSKALKIGIPTVLDMGRIGYLRYKSATQILAYVGLFDCVQMTNEVAMSLRRRAGLESHDSFLDVGRARVLCITHGASGVELHAKSGGSKQRPVDIKGISNVRIADSAGAGDAFLAHLLSYLIRHHRSQNHPSGGDLFGSNIEEAARSALKRMKTVLQFYGARGHLHRPRTGGIGKELTRFVGKELESIKTETRRLRYCPFCGLPSETSLALRKSPRNSQKPIIGMRRNISYLLTRVFFSAEQREAISKCREFAETVRTGYVVGTGGSFPAANFIAHLLNMRANTMFLATRPFDFCRVSSPTDGLIAVTYSGSTYDCELAIKHAKRLGVSRVAVVTAFKEPRLTRLLNRPNDVIISYREKAGSFSPERGFVSIEGTVSPCALWTAATVGPTEMARLAREMEDKINGHRLIWEISELLEKNGVLHVFGSGMAWPAMLDIESKLTEGGIGTAHLHESKDFSHGRFILVFGEYYAKKPKLLVRVGTEDPYEDMLEEMLRKVGPLLVLSSRRTGPVGSLEMLIEVQFLIREIASYLRLDISRPENIPTEGLRLYRWRRGR